MNQAQYEEITPKQRDALLKVYARPIGGEPNPQTWEDFRDSAYLDFSGVVMVPWAGMHLGIETDGFTHS